MSGIMLMQMASPVVTSFTIQRPVVETSIYAETSDGFDVNFSADGTVAINPPGWPPAYTVTAQNWYIPTTGGIGSTYWVRWLKSSGPLNTTTWLALSTPPSISFPGAAGAAMEGYWQYATDSAGSNIVHTSALCSYDIWV
jgi:hypothetical protein